MTKEEIIKMAKQAGFVEYELDDGTTGAFDKRYEAFAKLVAKKEREACAKEAETTFYSVQAAENIRAKGTRMTDAQPEQEPVAKKHEPTIDLGKYAGTYGGYIKE